MCDFLLVEFVKDSIFVPPLPIAKDELRNLITSAVGTLTQDMPAEVWNEFDYHVDI